MNPHRIPPASIKELSGSLWRNRHLILQLTRREIVGRYRGSLMGFAWSFFNPLLMLAAYTFVFSAVFKGPWVGSVTDHRFTLPILLFIGIIVHGVFAECANRAPTMIVANANFVKKVVFPLEIIPWVTMGSTLFHAGISVAILLLAQLLITRNMAWTVVFFPVVMLPLLLFTMGVAWILSALGVYVRDISHTTGVVTTVLLFLSPVFYPRSAVPAPYQRWVALNPLTFPLEESRKSLVFGQTPNGLEWSLYMLLGIAVAWIGFWWFQKARKGFADVL